MSMSRTKKLQITAAIIILMAAVCFLWHFRYFFTGPDTTPVHAHSNADFGIPEIQSSIDMDGDGIDDQTDILMSARSYIAQKPIYKSKYYASGYPDDNYGVCTDVVANALKNAGYDLMQLVYDDVTAHPEDYSIDTPDIRIDFRRVANLKVYFDHTAIALTTDVHDISAWQGGDIVVFQNHIGIVSDQRNSRGVPYVIHHNGRFQARYEEDILEKRDDITGHYRI